MRLHARETKASWSSRRRSRRRPDGVCCQSSAGRPATDRSRLPFFWRGRGSRPRTRGSSRVRRPRSAPRAGCRATCRRRLPAAGGPGAASRSARAEPQLQGQELPSDVLVQDIQNALQTQPVRHRLRPRRPLGPRRQQRLDQCPQVVVHDPRPSRHTHPDDQTVTTVTPDQDRSTRSCYELQGQEASLRTIGRARPGSRYPKG